MPQMVQNSLGAEEEEEECEEEEGEEEPPTISPQPSSSNTIYNDVTNGAEPALSDPNRHPGLNRRPQTGLPGSQPPPYMGIYTGISSIGGSGAYLGETCPAPADGPSNHAFASGVGDDFGPQLGLGHDGPPVTRDGHTENQFRSYPQPQSLGPGGVGDGMEGLFTDVDGFDWLWNNDISDTFLPTVLFDTDPVTNGTAQLPHSFPTHEASGPAIGASTANAVAQPGLDTTSYKDNSNTRNNRGGSLAQRREGAIWTLDGELSAAGDTAKHCPWRISPQAYDSICSSILLRSSVLPPDFAMPSRHTLSRYVEGYFRGFHEHLPFLHMPTFLPSDVPEELLLALAAVGALYKLEPEKGYEIYFAARALTAHHLREKAREASSHLVGSSPRHSNASSRSRRSGAGAQGGSASDGMAARGATSPSSLTDPRWNSVRVMQTLNILISMASWGEGTLVSEALEMASQLAVLLRNGGVSKPDPIPPEVRWRSWITSEERRRTMLVGYAILNLHSVAFNIPPLIMNQEVDLFLPHPMDVWRASTEAGWLELRQKCTHAERTFKDVLADLVAGHDVGSPTQISSFGNFILIHGLVQQIFTERQVISLRSSGPSLSQHTVAALDTSLRSWQHCWSSTLESTLDPHSSNGPLAFNSTALLRIAYIRLSADLGPRRSVLPRNPVCLARSVAETPTAMLERSSHTELAVLQCIHALGILVRAGVAFVSRTHAQSWSIIHSLGNMECACFLSLWLRKIASVVQQRGIQELRDDERRLVGMITSVVNESPLADELNGEPEGEVKIQRLAACTVRIWADALQGDHVFEMVHTVAKGLSLAADILVQ